MLKLTCGIESPERANQAFTVAATAVASGSAVSLWLTGESVWFAVPGRAEQLQLEHATPMPDLLAVILEAGRVTVCTQCAARRGLSESELLPGVRIAGSAAFVEQALEPSAQAIVY